MANTTKTKKIQKKLQFGIEFELFTLDKEGYMTNGAERLIKRVKKEHPDIEIKPECGKNMIEVTTAPETEVPDTILKSIDDFEKILVCAKKEDLMLYAYGTYPGSFTAEIVNSKRYKALEKIFGKQRFANNQRCIGLHIHYSLPWGVFDSLKKIIKPLLYSKNAQCMVNIYNFYIAMDPALTTFTQSSPFYQRKILAKDSRMLVYRGGKELDYMDGLYADYPELGALQNYRSTNSDILRAIKERFEEWGKIVKKIGLNVVTLTKYGSILDNTWNPVKISAHGTMEIRGMDMNHPDIIAAVAVVVKFITKAIQEQFLNIVPSDIGIKEPFKKDGKNIFIPPDSYVRKELQKKSAYFGLEDDAVYNYCFNLLKLARPFIPERRLQILKPLEDMLESRQTASDRIVKVAKQLGMNPAKGLTEGEAALLAKNLSSDLYREFILTKENLLKYLSEN